MIQWQLSYGSLSPAENYRSLKTAEMIADIYISTSMETFEHRKYKIRGENGNN